MITDPNDSVFPCSRGLMKPDERGITKRELMAAMIMAGSDGLSEAADMAVRKADALIKRLNETAHR